MSLPIANRRQANNHAGWERVAYPQRWWFTWAWPPIHVHASGVFEVGNPWAEHPKRDDLSAQVADSVATR